MVAEAVCAMLSAAGPGGLAPSKQRAAGYAALGNVAEVVLVERDNGACSGAAAGDFADRTLQKLAALTPSKQRADGYPALGGVAEAVLVERDNGAGGSAAAGGPRGPDAAEARGVPPQGQGEAWGRG